jgi:hypothetical protein
MGYKQRKVFVHPGEMVTYNDNTAAAFGPTSSFVGAAQHSGIDVAGFVYVPISLAGSDHNREGIYQVETASLHEDNPDWGIYLYKAPIPTTGGNLGDAVYLDLTLNAEDDTKAKSCAVGYHQVVATLDHVEEIDPAYGYVLELDVKTQEDGVFYILGAVIEYQLPE